MALPPDQRGDLQVPREKGRGSRDALLATGQAAPADVVQVPRDGTAIDMLGEIVYLLAQRVSCHALLDQMNGMGCQQPLAGEYRATVNHAHGEAPLQPGRLPV